MPTRKITYTGLLDDVYFRPKEIDNQEVVRLMRLAQTIPQQMLTFNGVIHVIDYTQRRHVAFSGQTKNLVGYHPEEVMNNGIDFVIDIFHKDDFKIYNDNIFGKVTELLAKTPHEDHKDYLFTFTYRLKNASGRWVNIYQQGTYVTDPKTNLPLYSIALVADISPIKKDTGMIFSIDKKRAEGKQFDYKNISADFFYPDPEIARLSKREREIVGRLAEGLSSKQIAGKLFLSESTVVNHRKNILKKTNAKNVAELIQYAIQRGII